MIKVKRNKGEKYSGTYGVYFRQKSNRLDAYVEVISTSTKQAEEFAKQKFFPGWEVIGVDRIKG